MNSKYRYGYRPNKRRRMRIFIVLVISCVLIGSVAAVVVLDMRRNQSASVQGATKTVVQAFDGDLSRLTVEEPYFSFELPGGWKEIARRKDASEHSITWRATKKSEQNRILMIYVDTIPTTRAVNRLVPLTSGGSNIVPGDISDNCSTFTETGSFNARAAIGLPVKRAKWQKVDFLCNLPRVFDNETGTGSKDGINTIKVTGPKQGTHKYFFVYTDHNIQPDYTIFVNALRSFRAK